MMFLPESKWSPRYESQFYTIRMNTYVTLHKPPSSLSAEEDDTFGSNDDISCSFFRHCKNCNSHNTKFPAVYYKIDVLRGNTQHTCLRRYSHFVYLCDKVDLKGEMHKHLPPKTITFFQRSNNKNKEFLDRRMVGLNKFLMDVLLRPESVNNKWIEAFLELDKNSDGIL